MTPPLEEWQHHIVKDPPRPGDGSSRCLALCGEMILEWEWAFVNIDHAKTSVEKNDRLQPCPKCWELVK